MRVCSPQIRLSSSSRLGGGVYDYEVLRRLAALGAEIDIPHLLPAAAEPVPGWNIVQIPLKRQYRLGALLTNGVFALWTMSLVRRRRPDLLRIAYPWYSGPALRTVARLNHLKTVVAFHHLEEKENPLQRRVQAWVARNSDGIHVGSRFAASQVASRYGVSEDRIEVIPYGVDDRFSPDEGARQRARSQRQFGSRPVLLYVGGFTDRKNLILLVDVFESLVEEHKNALLILCGEGYPHEDYAERLRRRVETSPARGAIRFLEGITEQDKLELYRSCDVLVHPSRLEGFGLSVAEAMACGAAVLASRAGSLPEVVEDGTTGLLADPDDRLEFSASLSRLVHSPALRRSLGKRASQAIRSQFSWDRTASLTLSYYSQLVKVASR